MDQETNFDICLKFTLLPDNDGQPLHIDKNDPGGATIYGITYNTYKTYFGNYSLDSFKNITKEQINTIYKNMFWDKMQCDKMPLSIACMVFDFGVTCGTYRSIIILQKCLRVTTDGIVGPNTIKAISGFNEDNLLNYLYTYQLNFYKSLYTYKFFGQGWSNRTHRRYIYSGKYLKTN